MATEETSGILKTPAQVARDLAVSKKKVYALIALGELEAIKIGPRGLRIPVDSLAQFLDRNRVKAAR